VPQELSSDGLTDVLFASRTVFKLEYR